jgi:2'-5' RNA ligase
MDEQFLNVMAVLDDSTQQLLAAFQKKIIALGFYGSQTMGIPFHVSLGTFPLSAETDLVSRLPQVAQKTVSFQLTLDSVETFSNQILYLKPTDSAPLLQLHQQFDCHYGNDYEWTPHVTLFCGNVPQVVTAKKLIEQRYTAPLVTTVCALQLCCFFPRRFICNCDLSQPTDLQ